MQENPLKPVESRFPKLIKDTKTDVVIVGGGITGILCSYFLKKSNYESIVVEMDEVGSGASGASSGILYYGTGLNLVPSTKIWDKQTAQFIWKETLQSIKELSVLAENLDCGFRKTGSIMVAKSDEQANLLEEEKKELGKIGINHSLLSSKELQQFYTGKKFDLGLHFENCSQLYPAVFASQLAKNFGLNLYEYTKMLGFEQTKDEVIIKTSDAKIKCTKLIFATNDFPVPPEKSLGLEKHFIPESSVILASQKLTEEQIKKVYPEEKILWTMESDYDIVYPHENRLILEMYRLSGIKEKLSAFYPGFDFKTEAQWGSSWAKTKDYLPIAGEFQKNIFTAMATGDQGTTVGYTIAKNIIDMIEGKKNKFLELTDSKRFFK